MNGYSVAKRRRRTGRSVMHSRPPSPVLWERRFRQPLMRLPKLGLNEREMTDKKEQRLGARNKLRAHFLQNIGRVMSSEELRAVAGNQSEWGRRVRELRTEEGYLILTHNDRSELKPGQYLLETA